MENVRWRIYPTLLNRFAEFKRGKASEQDVLDMINHTEKMPTEAMLRGKAYHKFTEEPFPEAPVIDGNYHFHFWKFPVDITNMIREERAGGRHEVFNERLFDTGKNKVMLFCIADTIKEGIIYDLKLTGFYRGLSYLYSWQHKVSLFVIPNRGFRYLITDFHGIYYEDYYYDFTKGLAVIVDEMVDFLDSHDKLITYEKIRQGYWDDFPRKNEDDPGGRKNNTGSTTKQVVRRSNKRISSKKTKIPKPRGRLWNGKKRPERDQ